MQSIPLAVLKLLPVVATQCFRQNCMQSIPLAVLKQRITLSATSKWRDCMQSIPLAVLKLAPLIAFLIFSPYCMQSIPLAVLKHKNCSAIKSLLTLHAVHTACGIETCFCYERTCTYGNCMQSIPLAVLKLRMSHGLLNHIRIACSPYRLRY